MVLRICPQCGTKNEDDYGFCIKCGHEFPQIDEIELTCPLCGYKNPEEADYCVKCGTPMLFKNQNANSNAANPIVINKTISEPPKRNYGRTAIIVLGYFFSLLGGILGLIIAIYLSTRKDPISRRHGHIQLAIFVFYVLFIAIMFATGNISADVISEYRQLLAGNFTSLQM